MRIVRRESSAIKIAEASSLNLTDEQKVFLDKVNDFNLETRYPDYKLEYYNSCTKELTDKYLIKIKEYHKWLKFQIK